MKVNRMIGICVSLIILLVVGCGVIGGVGNVVFDNMAPSDVLNMDVVFCYTKTL